MTRHLRKDYMKLVLRAWRYRLRAERPEIRFLLNHLEPDQTVIDIGAHKGAYTYWMSHGVGPSGQVIAFEPQPDLNQNLSKMSELFTHNNIQVESFALSSNSGNATLGVPSKTPSPSASLNKTNTQNGSDINVQTTTLDEYVVDHKLKTVDLIKCDVEGHELDVFIGGSEILKRYKPVVMFECEARHNGPENVRAVFDFLFNLNYMGCFYDGKSFVDLDQFDLVKYQTDPNRKIYVNNFFFTPKSD
ncbi:MAG: FkbM family methyltransferase [Candidatus Marinimicrobia bacterium]|nr:FkbM family methyltransferase [Candidatus Neomarinimicrobiota bacterium]